MKRDRSAAVRVEPESTAYTAPPVQVALVLDLIGQPPVLFHRAYVSLTGSVKGALWLSYAMGRRMAAAGELTQTSSSLEDPLWFSFSHKDCEDGTGLSRNEQDSARRELAALGIVMERRRATKEIAIDTRRLGALLAKATRSAWGIKDQEPAAAQASIALVHNPRAS